MRAPRTNASGWAQAGRDAARSFISIFDTTRKYAPRYDELAEVGIKQRSQEKQAAIKAESLARRAEINAETQIEKTKISVDEFNAKQKAKGTIRKAGLVAAAGSAIGLALTPAEEPIRPETLNYDEFIDRAKGKLEEAKDNLANFTPSADSIESNTTKDTDNEPAKNTSTSGNSAVTGGSTSAGKASTPSKKGSKGMRLMNTLIGQGYSPVSAAAIVGNAAHESGNFKHYEELAPNAYGTKGVGFLQWTNAGGANRRTEFENYAKSKGLDPRSFEASASYIDTEMRGGRHWTGGMNTDEFKGIKDLNQATISFQDNYLRPNKDVAGTDARLNYANQFYNEYMNR